jgi:hypothetical protein
VLWIFISKDGRKALENEKAWEKWGARHLEICTLLGYYAASSGNSIPTIWDKLWVPSSGVKKALFLLPSSISWPLKMGTTGCPETSVRICHCTLRSNPEYRRSYLIHAGSVKSYFSLGWQMITIEDYRGSPARVSGERLVKLKAVWWVVV